MMCYKKCKKCEKVLKGLANKEVGECATCTHKAIENYWRKKNERNKVQSRE